MKHLKTTLAATSILALTACGNVDSTHLIFGQQQSVGLDIGASAPEQGGSLSLGYKDRNIAVIPVAVRGVQKETQNSTSDQSHDNYTTEQDYIRLGSTNSTPFTGGDSEVQNPDRDDAYSTIGQFELDTGDKTTVSVGLQKFFATGIAAQTLAEGFKARLSKIEAVDEEEETSEETPPQ